MREKGSRQERKQNLEKTECIERKLLKLPMKNILLVLEDGKFKASLDHREQPCLIKQPNLMCSQS